MTENSTRAPRGWVPWRWITGAVLVAAAVGGLGIAHTSATNAAYVGGLILFAVATLGVFTVISTSYGPSPLTRIEPFPAHGALRWAVGGIVGVIAIAGLFHAATVRAGSLDYYDALGIFVAAVAYDFVLLKDWFDRRYRPRPHHG